MLLVSTLKHRLGRKKKKKKRLFLSGGKSNAHLSPHTTVIPERTFFSASLKHHISVSAWHLDRSRRRKALLEPPARLRASSRPLPSCDPANWNPAFSRLSQEIPTTRAKAAKDLSRFGRASDPPPCPRRDFFGQRLATTPQSCHHPADATHLVEGLHHLHQDPLLPHAHRRHHGYFRPSPHSRAASAPASRRRREGWGRRPRHGEGAPCRPEREAGS